MLKGGLYINRYINCYSKNVLSVIHSSPSKLYYISNYYSSRNNNTTNSKNQTQTKTTTTTTTFAQPPKLKPFFNTHLDVNRNKKGKPYNNNNNNNNNVTTPTTSTTSTTIDNKPPQHIVKKIVNIVGEIFNAVSKNDIEKIKSGLNSLDLLKVRHYQQSYPIIQSLLEKLASNKKLDEKVKNDSIVEILSYCVGQGWLFDFVNVYFYNLVIEDQYMTNKFEHILRECNFKTFNHISNEIIKYSLEFRRVDIALQVYLDRFTKFGIGNTKETTYTFTNHFLLKKRYRWALLWGSQTRDDEKIAKLIKGLGAPPKSIYSQVEFIYQEIYSFIYGEKQTKLPNKPTQFDKFTGDRYDQELVDAQRQLDFAIRSNDAPMMLSVLKSYFFPNNKIPYYNTLLCALQFILEHYKADWVPIVSSFPDYIFSIIKNGSSDLKDSTSFLQYTCMPSEDKLNHVFHRLLRQPIPDLPIRLYNYISGIDGFKANNLQINHFCQYLSFHFSKIHPQTIDNLLEKLSKSKQTAGTTEYKNVLLLQLFGKFKKLRKSPTITELEFNKAHDKLMDFYFGITFKNQQTFDIGIEIYSLRYPIPPTSNFKYWNKLYLNAATSNTELKIFNDRLFNKLVDIGNIELLDKILSEDEAVLSDITPLSTLKYYQLLINQNQNNKLDNYQLVLDRFAERENHNSFYSKELIALINIVNNEIQDPLITQTLKYIEKKDVYYIDTQYDDFYEEEELTSQHMYTLECILSVENYKPGEPLPNLLH